MNITPRGHGDVRYSSGIGFGTLIAALISWKLNASVGWVILHGILGWIYVIYWAIFISHL